MPLVAISGEVVCAASGRIAAPIKIISKIGFIRIENTESYPIKFTFRLDTLSWDFPF
jgi:hypothetical protein